ncbi:MAG: hypothetical protein ACREXR_13915 [Gammaproteobacteria bacterium]
MAGSYRTCCGNLRLDAVGQATLCIGYPAGVINSPSPWVIRRGHAFGATGNTLSGNSLLDKNLSRSSYVMNRGRRSQADTHSFV